MGNHAFSKLSLRLSGTNRQDNGEPWLSSRTSLIFIARPVNIPTTPKTSPCRNRRTEKGCPLAIVAHFHAAFARIWTLNPTKQINELQASAGLYTHINGPHSRIPVGQFQFEQIAAEKKPHLTNAMLGDPRIPEQEWAKQEGLVPFAGILYSQTKRCLGSWPCLSDTLYLT